MSQLSGCCNTHSGRPQIVISSDATKVVVAPGYDTVAVYDYESGTLAYVLKVCGIHPGKPERSYVGKVTSF